MKISQMRFQKTICIVALVTAALTLLYAWVFATDFYGLTSIQNNVEEMLEEGYAAQPVYNFYYDILPFNKTLELLGFIFVIISALVFFFRCNVRRRYYFLNYAITGIYVSFGAFYSFYTLINIIHYQGIYASFDFESLKNGLYEYYFNEYSEASAANVMKIFTNRVQTSTPIFIIGILLCVIVLAVAALVALNSVWKAFMIKAEDEKYREEDARIRAAQQESARLLAEEDE